MTPFVESGSRIRDAIATFKALRHGRYYLDTDRTIDRMAQQLAERQPPMVCTGITGDTTLRQIIDMLAVTEGDVVSKAYNLEVRSIDVENCRDILFATVHDTIWRLRCDAVTLAVSMVLGSVFVATGEFLAGAVSLVMAIVTAFSFVNELYLRGSELNSQYSYLYTLCHDTAAESLYAAIMRDNLRFMYSVVERRFDVTLAKGSFSQCDLDEPYAPDI